MSDVRTCLLCGIEDRDVVFGLVEIPKDERRIVTVQLPVVHREGAVEEPHHVREQYAAMPRCRDRGACAERVAAIERALHPIEEQAVEDPMAWL